METICYPIITKPKPTTPPPPQTKPTEKGGSKASGGATGGATDDGKGNAASLNTGKTPNVPNGGEAPDPTHASNFAGGEEMDVD